MSRSRGARVVCGVFVWLGLVALVGCDGAQGASDMGAPSDGGADASPGLLGSACTLSNTDGGCSSGYHCGIATIGDATRDVCVPDAPTPVIEGNPCSNQVELGRLGGTAVLGDQCSAGAACMESGGTLECHRLCKRRTDCGAVEVCGVPSGSPSKMGGCVLPDSCDPILKTGCRQGLTCYVGGDSGGRFTSCQLTRATAGGVTSSCAAQRDCDPGLYCAGVGFCRTLCWMLPPDGVTAGLCGPAEKPCSRLAGAPDNVGVCDDP